MKTHAWWSLNQEGKSTLLNFMILRKTQEHKWWLKELKFVTKKKMSIILNRIFRNNKFQYFWFRSKSMISCNWPIWVYQNELRTPERTVCLSFEGQSCRKTSSSEERLFWHSDIFRRCHQQRSRLQKSLETDMTRKLVNCWHKCNRFKTSQVNWW